jgi:hypothetical protein
LLPLDEECRVTPLIVKAVQDIANLADSFKSKLIAWFASVDNGIGDFFAHHVHSGDLCLKKSDGTEAYVTGDQLAQLTAAGTPAHGDGTGAPGGSSTPVVEAGTDTATPTTSDKPGPPQLQVNRANPAQWDLNKPWQDNLGALFTNAGQSETVYSTSTVDVSTPGMSTVDYWAQIPGAEWLHATRDVVVGAPANDNPPPLTPTGTSTATTTP